MRKDCELEFLPTPKSKCYGPNKIDCGVTMVNKKDFEESLITSTNPLL